ncbi:hypothetical protein D9M69_548530 [compost metagenome]
MREEQLGRAQVHVGPVALGAQCTQRAVQPGGLQVLELHAHGDLRHQAVAVQHGVASHTHFGAHDVLLQVQAGQAQAGARDAGVEVLPAHREFDAVVDAHRHAIGGETVVPRPGAADIGRYAHFALGGLAADHGPGRNAATGRAFNAAHTPGEQQLAGVGTGGRRGQQRNGCGKGQESNGEGDVDGHGERVVGC